MKLFGWLHDPSSLDSSHDPEAHLAPRLQERLHELQRMSVKDAMIPRALISALDVDVQLRRVRRLKSAKVAYFPVYKGDLDHILGWIPKTKVLELLSHEPMEEAKVVDHVKPVGEVAESATVAELADVFLRAASPFLVVKSESGQTTGLVTLAEFVELMFGFELGHSTPTAGGEITLMRGYEL